MTLRLILISAPSSAASSLCDKVEELGATTVRTFEETQGGDRTMIQFLAGPEARQELVDTVQSALSGEDDWRITILPVETTVPLPRDEEEEQERRKQAKENAIGGMTREEIWNRVWDMAKLDQVYLMFVFLSTVVAALGMLTDSVAVVVGAMVIAPLLGPNLAFSVGVALGDVKLILRSMATSVSGFLLAFVLSVAIGYFWTEQLRTDELLARADVTYAGMAIALASGAAAGLSLVTGVSSAFVGVMVAVALLPPTSAAGIFLGGGYYTEAGGALLLLAVNAVSINLASHTVLLWRGVRPRTFFEDKKAKRGRIASSVTWAVLLAVLAGLIWWTH